MSQTKNPSTSGYQVDDTIPTGILLGAVTDAHIEATSAGLDMLDAIDRDPTAEDIPREQRGSFVERLGSVSELAQAVRQELGLVGLRHTADAMQMIIKKVDGIASDLALESSQ